MSAKPVRHPSKFHPRTLRIRGTIQVRLSFQIDGLLTGPSQLQCNTQPVKPNGMIGPSKWLPKTSLTRGVPIR